VSGQPVCPQCSANVEPHWEWCHNCLFDPENKRPTGSALLSSTSSAGPATGLLSGAMAHDGPALPAALPPGPGAREPAPAYDPGSFTSDSFTSDLFSTDSFSTSFTPFDSSSPTSFAGEHTTGEPGGGAFDALQSLTSSPPEPSDWDRGLPSFGTAGEHDPFGSFPTPPTPTPGMPPFGPGPARPVGAPDLGRPVTVPGSRFGLKGGRSGPSLSLPSWLVKGLGALVVCAVLLAGIMYLVTSGGTGPRTRVPTSIDPSAPPIGQIPLDGRSSGVGAAPAAPLGPGWTSYQAADGTFSATFPGPVDSQTLTANPAMQLVGGVAASTTADGATFAVFAQDMGPAYLYVPSAELETMHWVSAGTFEVAPGLVATSFVNGPDVPETRGFFVAKGRRFYLVMAAGASDADFHQFIHGFRWLADPA
jgi:hypothetical protein